MRAVGVGRQGHIKALDGLRGIAILLVFSVHCFDWPQGGHLGVDLFFILSGFLITTLLLEEREAAGRIDLARFYARRASRLLPALGLLLAVYLVIDAAKGHNGIKVVVLGGLYFGNLVQAFGNGHTVIFDSGLDHLWTLAQEEQFYLVWPLALPFIARARRPIRLLAALIGVLIVYRAALALNGAPHYRLYSGPDTHLDGLIAGAAVAFLLVRRPQFAVPRLLVAIALPVVVDAILIRPAAAGWDAFALPIVEAAAVVVFLAALTLPMCGGLLAVAPLVWFGRISYSLYLWHFVLVWAFNGHNRLIPAALSIAIAYTSTRWIEEPIRRRRRIVAPLAATPAFAD
jgi:peptidoglycan/LPS O-acetylase OafA/YrhL